MNDAPGLPHDLVEAGESVCTVEEYRGWLREHVRRVFPHEMHASGFGNLTAGGVSLDYVITVDFPMRHIEQLRNRVGAIDSPILRRWIALQEPQLFEAEHPWPDAPQAWVEAVRANGLVNIASHGVYDREACVASYFSFHRIPGRLGEAHVEALRQISPAMHRVLCRVIEGMRPDPGFAQRMATLSIREREIAQWVKSGKSNTEIATLSNMSENTVKHHLTHVFKKLGVETRAQLALQLVEHEAQTQPGSTRIV